MAKRKLKKPLLLLLKLLLLPLPLKLLLLPLPLKLLLLPLPLKLLLLPLPLKLLLLPLPLKKRSNPDYFVSKKPALPAFLLPKYPSLQINCRHSKPVA